MLCGFWALACGVGFTVAGTQEDTLGDCQENVGCALNMARIAFLVAGPLLLCAGCCMCVCTRVSPACTRGHYESQPATPISFHLQNAALKLGQQARGP